MSETQTPDPQKPEMPQAKKRPARRSRRWWVVLLALVILGIAAQQLWTWRLWDGLQREESQMSSVDSRMAGLETAVDQQQPMRQDIEALRQSLQHERALLRLDRIEQQLDAGWQIWQATGDMKVLVSALQSGQRVLASDASASAQALRLAMAQDLADLKSQQVVDIAAAVAQLDGVIANIDQLPLLQEHRLPMPVTEAASPAAVEPTAQTLMDKARVLAAALANDLWQSVRSMVRVQRLDRAEPGLMAPEQKVFLQQGLRLLLLDARHALVQRNPAVYQQTLTQARAWIEKYDDTSNALVKEALKTLQQLSALKVDAAALSLSATRQALATARSDLTGEPLEIAAPVPTEVPGAESTVKAMPQETAKGATP